MATDDIKFSTSTITDVYKPLEVVATTSVNGEIQIIITNYGTESISNLGVFLSIAANQGDVDNPADYAPHIDYQDLLTWGTAAWRTSTPGGLIIYPSGATTGTRVRRGVGSDFSSRIPLSKSGDALAAGANVKITAVMEVPSTAVARRMFVNLSVE